MYNPAYGTFLKGLRPAHEGLPNTGLSRQWGLLFESNVSRETCSSAAKDRRASDIVSTSRGTMRDEKVNELSSQHGPAHIPGAMPCAGLQDHGLFPWGMGQTQEEQARASFLAQERYPQQEDPFEGL